MQEDQDLGMLFVESCELENDRRIGNIEKVEGHIERLQLYGNRKK